MIGRLALAGVAIAAAVLRLHLCLQLPQGSSDLLRQVAWGSHVARDGLAIASQPLASLNPGLAHVPFAHNPYNYPPMALAFFSACAALKPCLLLPKLALTFVEAVNAMLLARLAGRAWIGVLYWIAPLSVLLVSGEGQFEPLQNCLVLAAAIVFPVRPALAFALAGLAIQTKITGGAILIYFVWEILRARPRLLFRCLAALVLSFAPAVIFQIHYPWVQQVLIYSTEFPQNPAHWNFLDASYHGIYKVGWAAYSQVISWVLLGLLAWEIRRGIPWHNAGPGILHIAYLKTSPSLLPWYWLVLPSLGSPMARARTFGVLCLLVGIADIPSLMFLANPAGPYDAGMYRGLQVWTNIRAVF